MYYNITMTEIEQLLAGNGNISDAHKKDIRKLLKNNYAGKSFDADTYLSMVKDISKKFNSDFDTVREFINSYTVSVDEKMLILAKKAANGSKAGDVKTNIVGDIGTKKKSCG